MVEKIKTTFGTHQEVCHIWASQSQKEGKAGYFRFKGKTLYCWGKPVARLYGEKTVLISNGNVTDCRVREKICKAIPKKSYKIFHVDSVEPLNHMKNIAMFMTKIKSAYRSFWMARQGKSNGQWCSQYQIHQLRRYVKHFGLKMPSLKGVSLNTKKAILSLQQYNEKVISKLWDDAHYVNKRRDEVLCELQEIEKLWICGKSDATSVAYHDYHRVHFSTTRVRIYPSNKKQLETSLGAYVPLRAARKIYQLIKDNKSVKGKKIGSYTITRFNGSLNVGCHEISRDEIERFAKSMNW